jgi:hypothetical protein
MQNGCLYNQLNDIKNKELYRALEYQLHHIASNQFNSLKIINTSINKLNSIKIVFVLNLKRFKYQKENQMNGLYHKTFYGRNIFHIVSKLACFSLLVTSFLI